MLTVIDRGDTELSLGQSVTLEQLREANAASRALGGEDAQVRDEQVRRFLVESGAAAAAFKSLTNVMQYAVCDYLACLHPGEWPETLASGILDAEDVATILDAKHEQDDPETW